MTTLSLHENHPKEITINSLPCNIKYTGKANVTDFFVETAPNSKLPNQCGINGSIVDNKLDQEKYSYDEPSVYFRGRALLKRTIKFDDGIKGFYLKKTETANNIESVWETQGKFDQINVWRLTNKKRIKYENTINNWFKISAAINDSVKKLKSNKENEISPNATKTEEIDIDSIDSKEEEK